MSITETPQSLQRAIHQQLQLALNVRGHPWRTPVLANVDENDMPQARTVVLRGVENDGHLLTMFTDRRSPKSRQLQGRPTATLVFWHPELQWQLRAQGPVTVDTDRHAIDTVWESIRNTAAAGDYLTPSAPGEPLKEARALAPEEHQLAILRLAVERSDWLCLSRTGHQRAGWGIEHPFRWLTP